MDVHHLFMIEAIDVENNMILLANYIFRKRYEVVLSKEQIQSYFAAFHQALDANIYLSVEFDEKKGTIVI